MRSSQTVRLPSAQSRETLRASREKVSSSTESPVFERRDLVQFLSVGCKRSRGGQGRSQRACHPSPGDERCLWCLRRDRLYAPLSSLPILIAK
jgi:hypothetical protein